MMMTPFFPIRHALLKYAEVSVVTAQVIEIDNSATASRTSGIGFYGEDPMAKCQNLCCTQNFAIADAIAKNFERW